MIRRGGQKWILTEFFKVHNVFSYRNMMYVEWGFKLSDILRTNDRLKHPGMVSKEWVRTARQQEEMAKSAEDGGKLQTAAEFYHRAALYYTPAAGSIYENSDRKLDIYAHLIDCYKKFIELSELQVERVEIPFENGKQIPGILQTVPGKTNVPCVICIPGMDTVKEHFPSPYNNPFVRRGMASLTIDGPGQGESLIREIWVTPDNFDRAGRAAIDYLTARPEINPEKIGLYGWSRGSPWGLGVAANDSRIKAFAGAMGARFEAAVGFEENRPGSKVNFMYMMNIKDEEAFDKAIKNVTLANVLERITCPVLIATGEFDELVPLSSTEKVYENLTCPKELWIFENENHVMGGRLADYYPMMADWLKDKIDGKFEKEHKKRIFFEAR